MTRPRLLTLACAVVAFGLTTWTCAHRPSRAEGHESGRLSHGGRQRSFIAFTPDGAGPFPLVVALHGRGGTGANMLGLTHLTQLAQREGFIVVYPDGVERSWADGRNASPASKQGVDDVGFLSALIDDFVARGKADASRVYVLGMSNGGFMALTLACRAAEKVTAVGSVTGLMGVELAASCAPSRPVSVAIVAGDDDRLVPFDGGVLPNGRGTIVGAEEAFARWVTLLGCPSPATVAMLPDAAPDDGTAVERRELTGCRGGTSVRLDVVKGGGHTWPSGDRYLPEGLIGKTSQDVDASAELWRFFAGQRR